MHEDELLMSFLVKGLVSLAALLVLVAVVAGSAARARGRRYLPWALSGMAALIVSGLTRMATVGVVGNVVSWVLSASVLGMFAVVLVVNSTRHESAGKG